MTSSSDWRRADLHVHTSFSGWGYLRGIGARDCYVTPEAAFEAARARGMDFVCFTDHNTISGALDFLSRRPSEEPRVVIGEEVETRFPDTSQKLHVSVFDVDEGLHDDIERMRGNYLDLFAEMHSRGVFFALNHPFRGFRTIRSARHHLTKLLPLVPAVEVVNGSDPRSFAAILTAMIDSGGMGPKVLIGGSDAHRASRIGTVYTSAPGRTKAEYLRNVHDGRCRVGGSPPGFGPLVWDVYAVICEYYGRLLAGRPSPFRSGRLLQIPGAILLAPAVLAGVPLLLTLGQALRQEWIARFGRWYAPTVTFANAIEGAVRDDLPVRQATCEEGARTWAPPGSAFRRGPAPSPSSRT